MSVSEFVFTVENCGVDEETGLGEYFDKQQKQYCGVHAINNLFGRQVYSPAEALRRVYARFSRLGRTDAEIVRQVGDPAVHGYDADALEELSGGKLVYASELTSAHLEAAHIGLLIRTHEPTDKTKGHWVCARLLRPGTAARRYRLIDSKLGCCDVSKKKLLTYVQNWAHAQVIIVRTDPEDLGDGERLDREVAIHPLFGYDMREYWFGNEVYPSSVENDAALHDAQIAEAAAHASPFSTVLGVTAEYVEAESNEQDVLGGCGCVRTAAKPLAGGGGRARSAKLVASGRGQVRARSAKHVAGYRLGRGRGHVSARPAKRVAGARGGRARSAELVAGARGLVRAANPLPSGLARVGTASNLGTRRSAVANNKKPTSVPRRRTSDRNGRGQRGRGRRM